MKPTSVHTFLPLFVVCISLALCIDAHGDTVDDFHTWGAIVATGTVGEESSELRWWAEGQGRFNDDSSRFNQGILRTALGYKLWERATLWAGYAYIPSDPQGRPDDVIEHRVWQQLTWSAAEPVAGFSLATRTRLEQRTVERAEDTGLRFRQLVKITHPLQYTSLYLSIWDEVFVHLNDADWGPRSGLDQNRIFGGLGIRLSPQAKAEVGYLNQYVNRRGRSDAMNHILSLTLLLSY